VEIESSDRKILIECFIVRKNDFHYQLRVWKIGCKNFFKFDRLSPETRNEIYEYLDEFGVNDQLGRFLYEFIIVKRIRELQNIVHQLNQWKLFFLTKMKMMFIATHSALTSKKICTNRHKSGGVTRGEQAGSEDRSSEWPCGEHCVAPQRVASVGFSLDCTPDVGLRLVRLDLGAAAHDSIHEPLVVQLALLGASSHLLRLRSGIHLRSLSLDLARTSETAMNLAHCLILCVKRVKE